MLYLEMYGRTGNQFFRYASARALQLEYYPDEELIINFLQVNQASEEDQSFFNSLDDFNVSSYTVYPKDKKVLFAESSIFQKIVLIPYYLGYRKFHPTQMNQQLAYQLRWSKWLNKMGLYWFRTGFVPLKKSSCTAKFISGNFEDKRYFDKYREILQQELTPKYDLLPHNERLFHQIQQSESVCITIRRGDFETSDFKGLHSVCDKSYFLEAIDIMKKKLQNPTFFIFSDDIDWAKTHIETGKETYFERGDDPIWEKIRLMSACKHFILSNSSFSWWVQYLSRNPNKVVISPSRWFNNDYQCPLIEEEWIQIER